jgi:MoxR-like ATPase
MADPRAVARALEENLRRVFVGSERTLRLALVPLLCRSHLLIEDVPGTGKTTLARAIARSLDLTFRRVQFTPDLLPLDLTGSAIFHPGRQEFEFRPGPVFTHVLLADEINRATPRTQSALLECMEEFRVTADGVTRELPDPFFVIATLNPGEQTGTFPLPETQLDRFLLCIRLGYPNEEEELEIFARQSDGHPLERLAPAAGAPEVAALRDAARRTFLHESVRRYAIRLVRATRSHDDIALGAGPRATLHLLRAAQAFAFLEGAPFAEPDHVKAVACSVLAHRLVLKPQAILAGRTPADVVEAILRDVPVPVAAG